MLKWKWKGRWRGKVGVVLIWFCIPTRVKYIYQFQSGRERENQSSELKWKWKSNLIISCCLLILSRHSSIFLSCSSKKNLGNNKFWGGRWGQRGRWSRLDSVLRGCFVVGLLRNTTCKIWEIHLAILGNPGGKMRTKRQMAGRWNQYYVVAFSWGVGLLKNTSCKIWKIHFEILEIQRGVEDQEADDRLAS